MSNIFREEALPLISYDQDTEEYILNQEAVNIVRAMKGPIAVVGVVGLYRTGKSYLLNRVLLDRSNGFGVGPTVNACTKGIWIWGSPMKGQTADGDPCDVLVVDSEGIGALDEDATHDLKHNQSNSENEEDDEPCEEDYANFLPSFFWILRDFALQLQDEDGESISANEYLQKALAQQKGFTDEIEEKNRVRRLLSTFFQQRECYTLVRPLLDESKLQDLAECPIEDLRAEFYEQVVLLRKRIIQKAKLKTMYGKCLSGQMYMNLIQEYVKEINGGGVPNIQNAWSYLCKQENEKALSEAHRVYQENLKELVLVKLPMDLDELKQSHKMVKEIALEAFKGKSMGDEAQQFEIELNKKLKDAFYDLEENNKQQSKRMCLEFIKRGYYTIEIKLRPELRDIEYEQEKGLQQNEIKRYQNYKEFKRDLQMFWQYLNQLGPKVQKSKEIYLEFLHMKAIEAGQIFNTQLEQELETIREGNSTQGEQYQRELRDQSEEYEREREKWVERAEKAEDEKKLYVQREEQALLQQNKKDKLIKEMDRKMEEQRVKNKELESKLLQMQMKEQEEVEVGQQALREQKIKESEWNRERELFIQEKKLLTNDLKAMKERDKKLEDKYRKDMGILNQEKRKYQQELEENNYTLKREKTELQEKMTSLEERCRKWEEEVGDKAKELADRDALFQKKQKEFHKQTQEQNRLIAQLRLQLDKAENSNKKDIEMKMELNTRSQKDLEQSYRKLDLNQKKWKDEHEKEILMLSQKAEQEKAQAEEYKAMYEQVKKAFDNTISMMNKDEGGGRVDMKSMKQQRDQFEREKKSLEHQLESQKQGYLKQLEESSNKVQQMELQAKIEQNKSTKEKENMQEAMDSLQNKVTQLQDEIKHYEVKIQKGIENQEGRWRTMVGDLEMEIEELRRDHKDEINHHNNITEENIREIRLYYENQKDEYEKRAKDEREKLNKKYYQLNEDWEQRAREEEEIREEELEGIRDELRDKEAQLSSIVQQYEQELALKTQQNESLEKQIRENKETADVFRLELQQQLNNMQKNLQQENNSVQEKAQKYQLDWQKREKEVMVLTDRNENLQKQLQDAEKSLDNEKTQYKEEKGQLNKKIEELRRKYQSLNDEYLDKKIAYEKESALIKQQNQFMNSKIEDLQSQNDLLQNKQDEKIKAMREELLEESRDKVNYARQEKKLMEDKLEKLKKQYKELENNNIKKISELEKEHTYRNEHVLGLERKLEEALSKYETDTKKYQNQIQELNDQYTNEKKPLHIELQKYITINEKLENDKLELQQLYDREKIVMEGKLQFIQHQKDLAKNELQEQSKKFETSLQHFQSARKNDKNLQDSSLNDMIQQIESKYQSQLQEQQQTHERQLMNQEEKCRRFEKELREYQEHVQIEKQGKQGSQYLNEKKFLELLDNEKRLLKYIEELKNEREQKITENQRILDKDRETYRHKMNDLEQQIKESEKKRSQLIFDQEKERAKWNLEKDHLQAQKDDLQDQFEKAERKKEFLMKDNERLKNDNKNKRNMMGQTFLGNSNIGSGFQGMISNLPGKQAVSRLVGQSINFQPGNDQNSFNNFRKTQVNNDFELNNDDIDMPKRKNVGIKDNFDKQ